MSMKWTNNKPTKEGWYWYDPDGGFPEKRMIYFVDNDLDLWIDHHDYEFFPISEFDGKWAGPIPEPDE